MPSAKVSVSDSPTIPAGVSVAIPAAKLTIASTTTVQALGLSPKSRVALRV